MHGKHWSRIYRLQSRHEVQMPAGTSRHPTLNCRMLVRRVVIDDAVQTLHSAFLVDVHSTKALSGGFRYKPATSRSFSIKKRSVDSYRYPMHAYRLRRQVLHTDYQQERVIDDFA